MEKETVTFRVHSKKKKALDLIAAGIDRDRSYVLNEAVEAYIETHKWQIAHIKRAIKQADSGQFASDAEVNKAFTRWRKGK